MVITDLARRPRFHTSRQGGFTLLEVLIAVGITALVGIGVWQMINGVIRARDRVDAVAEEFAQLQRAMVVIERDFNQVVNRPIRDIYGDPRYALTSREEGIVVSLTHQGWRNPLGSRRSDLQRSTYEFTGDELHRRYWGTLDLAQDAEGRDQLLLSRVTDVQVRFMDENNNWQDEWPTAEGVQETSNSPGALVAVPLPKGVEVVIEHEQFGEVRRLFALPDFDPESAQGFISQQGGEGDAEEDEDDQASSDDQQTPDPGQDPGVGSETPQ
ncbi:GspJ family T2SS minor pseudopilin variant XcpW [Marinobacter nanhaiticus D15-8W]|uniref:Type II secretion system protein J n=1 Tax=Marinobacter nanhaiticus D15-8W TaxID=626887 RepID=N6W1D6_9GAMM|nr:type II secretion system protein GspJ [Marinobacter nanhaiticus D15-8W]BES71301.1 GspJ family T2SS minor pseudopilin variant XcpW [Marinobacter nanhaiticus D15-8W]